MILSLYSTFLFFLVSFMWLGLFYLMTLEYRKQICQVVLVSAMVDPKMRISYMHMYLKHGTVEEKHQAEHIMCNLPLLSLKVESNLTAFWKLRQYCTLDRSNERVGMHLLMDMVVFWFTLNLIMALAGLFIFQSLPASVPVMIFDIFTFAVVLIWALEGAMRVNSYMDDHETILKRARYDLHMELAQPHVTDVSLSERQELAEAQQRTCKMLDQHVSMIHSHQEQDRDRILLGYEVTPNKLLTAFFSFFIALMTISFKLYAMGVFDTIKHSVLNQKQQEHAASSLVQMVRMVQHFPRMQFLQKFHGLKF